VTDSLACPACRRGLVKRRGDALCPSCTRAAGEVAPSPSWVLDSPLLRQALAEANVPAVVAIVRTACGLSQQDMAAVVGWSRSALSCYERGRRDAVFDIRALLQFADAIGMPRAALLALLLADPDAAAGDSASLSGTAVGSHRPGEAQLNYWRACTDALHERDRQVGGTALLGPALLLLRLSGARQASPAPVHAGTASPGWSATAAEITLYAAQAALDAGCLTRGQALSDTARDLAASVDDPMLTAHVLLSQSTLGTSAARGCRGREPARQALLLARKAADEARYEPIPQLHALIAVRRAQAAALLGDKPAFDAAITRARRELDRHKPDGTIPVPAWLRHVGGPDITAAEATGTLDLGDAGRSVDLYRTALGQAACPRDRAQLGCELAHALAAHGDKAEAIATALDIALPLLETGVTSARCLDRLRHVTALAGAVRGTLEIRERTDALKRALPATTPAEPGTPPPLASLPVRALR
jgi:transcriptional regulator with XRE-family HTH domain